MCSAEGGVRSLVRNRLRAIIERIFARAKISTKLLTCLKVSSDHIFRFISLRLRKHIKWMKKRCWAVSNKLQIIANECSPTPRSLSCECATSDPKVWERQRKKVENHEKLLMRKVFFSPNKFVLHKNVNLIVFTPFNFTVKLTSGNPTYRQRASSGSDSFSANFVVWLDCRAPRKGLSLELNLSLALCFRNIDRINIEYT